MTSITVASPDKKTIRNFFDSIAARYDFLNRFLSFHLDDYWRKKSRDLILSGGEESVLDLGVGTGKFLEIFLRAQKWKRAVGLDFSEGMLKACCISEIASPFGLAMTSAPSLRGGTPDEAEAISRVDFINGDFQALPFAPASFDVVISAFTLRSVRDMQGFLSEVFRVLTRNGKTGFLCLTRPQNPFFAALYYPYLKFYLPWIGAVISGNREAYRFLAESILNFQEPDDTARMMEEVGFKKVRVFRFTFGIATLVTGEK